MSGQWESPPQWESAPATPAERVGGKFNEAMGVTPAQHDAFVNAMQNGFGSGVPKLAYGLGGKVTDLTGSPVAGYMTNVATQAIPALLSSFRPASVPASSPIQNLPYIGPKKLMQSAIKPSISDLQSGAADRAVQTALEENIGPTRAGMEKLGRVVSKLENQVQNAISNSDAQVNVGQIAGGVSRPYGAFRNQVDPQSDLNAIRNVYENFLNSPQIAGKESIPVQLAHLLKQGTYKVLGGKAYGEVGTAATEAQKGIAAAARQAVSEAVPSAVDPLAREANLMNLKDVAINRVLQEANKNPAGLAALRIGDNPLSSLSFLADRSAALKGLLAQLLFRTTLPENVTPAAVAVSPALQQRGALSGP